MGLAKNKLLGGYLDLVRFSAALAVVFGHAKLHAYGQTKEISPLVLFVSSFAHFAVLIFFVLSGYLVGGKLFRAGKTGFAPKYLVDRATRIYTVAIPAMIIAFALMLLQQNVYGHAYHITSDNCRGTIGQLGGSLLFLHKGMMNTPCFNGPYWSLIYEVFYYLFFFAVALAWYGRGKLRFTGLAAALFLGAYSLSEPGELWAYSTLWLLGMVAAQEHPFRGQALSLTLFVVGTCLLQTFLRLDDPVAIYEFVSGILVVGSILLFQRWQPFDLPQKLGNLVAFGAGMSYSLYLFHAPVMNLLRSVAEGAGYAIDPILMYILYISAACLASLGFWWLFERHTMTIRTAAETRLGIRTTHQAIPPNQAAADGPPLPVRKASQIGPDATRREAWLGRG